MLLLCCVSLNSPLVDWCGTRRQDYTRYSNTVEGITSFFTLLKFEERRARAPFRHDAHLNTYEPKYIHPHSSPAHAATVFRLCCGFLAASSVGASMRVANVRTWLSQSVWGKGK